MSGADHSSKDLQSQLRAPWNLTTEQQHAAMKAAADEIDRLNRRLDRIDKNIGRWMDHAAEAAEADAYREGVRDGRRFDEY